jgi:tRNA(fMet)-specific endonuclease VapC
MGLILDSSVLVAAERKGHNARQALEAIAQKIGNVDIAISVVTVMELAHGVARANTPERQAKRRQFVDDLIDVVPLHPITPAIALQAGLLDGESQARGVRIPLADLLIGVTARELGSAWGRPIHDISISCRDSPSFASNRALDPPPVMIARVTFA